MAAHDALSARVRAIFDREIADAVANIEPSPFVDWLTRLRDEVLEEVSDRG